MNNNKKISLESFYPMLISQYKKLNLSEDELIILQILFFNVIYQNDNSLSSQIISEYTNYDAEVVATILNNLYEKKIIHFERNEGYLKVSFRELIKKLQKFHVEDNDLVDFTHQIKIDNEFIKNSQKKANTKKYLKNLKRVNWL